MSTVRERPILFSAPMVRAIIEGRKTVTRRIVKPQPHKDATEVVRDGEGYFFDYQSGGGEKCLGGKWTCPYGVPGDRLWVRENLLWKYTKHGYECIERGHVYAATPDEWVEEYVDQKPMPQRNIPSIHMPRWASRLTLEVVSVRVERVQAITEVEAMNELGHNPHGTYPAEFGYHHRLFADLWDSINGAGSWKLNPWVRVVEFKSLTKAEAT